MKILNLALIFTRDLIACITVAIVFATLSVPYEPMSVIGGFIIGITFVAVSHVTGLAF